MDAAPFLLFLHISGVIVWVGGMFFAYVCLRPVAAEQLAAAERLRLWAGVLERFFAAVWAAVVAIVASGFAMLLTAGLAAAPWSWHLMMTLGLVMTAVFIFVFFVLHRRLRTAVAAADWSVAGMALDRIRRLVLLNLMLGVFTVAVATVGRYV